MLLHRVLFGSQFLLLLTAIGGAGAGLLARSDRALTLAVVSGTYAVMLLCTIFVLASTTDGENRRVGLPFILWMLAATGFIGGAGAAFARLFHLTGLSTALHWSAVSLGTTAILGWIAAWTFVLVAAALNKQAKTR
jgi:hypothetical protein